MSNEFIEKVKKLPFEKQQEIEDFANFLANKYIPEELSQEAIAEMRAKNMGRLKGQVWMADDFNETPEDFKDYL